jgi:hypothetical protein
MGFVPTSFGGVFAGRMLACGTESRYLNSGSGATRLIVTVPALSLAITPPFSVQVAGWTRHACAPTMPA